MAWDARFGHRNSATRFSLDDDDRKLLGIEVDTSSTRITQKPTQPVNDECLRAAVASCDPQDDNDRSWYEGTWLNNRFFQYRALAEAATRHGMSASDMHTIDEVAHPEFKALLKNWHAEEIERIRGGAEAQKNARGNSQPLTGEQQANLKEREWRLQEEGQDATLDAAKKLKSQRKRMCYSRG